jgi:hypothetical protein
MTDPGTRKFLIWVGVITLVIIILILIAVVVMYATRSLIFKPYKAKIPPDVKMATKDMNKSLTKTTQAYYCPNGCPEDDTGKPANYGLINTSLFANITNKLTQYSASSPSTNPYEFSNHITTFNPIPF